MTDGDDVGDHTVAEVTQRIGEVARCVAPAPAGYAGIVEYLDHLVDRWLTLPEVAERLELDVGKVRRLIRDRCLAAVRRGQPAVLSIPEALLQGSAPLPELRGTLTVLADAGYDDASALQWLFTPDESLPGTPIQALQGGRKTEVRRRAQALAF
jgi:hypothetical protein